MSRFGSWAALLALPVLLAVAACRHAAGRPALFPAHGRPARPGQPGGSRAGWVASMSTAQKLWTVGKLETQALYGTQVTVIGHSGTAWTRVAVPSQPTSRDKRGSPGWVPTRQLTRTAPPAAATTGAVVMTRLAWLRSSLTARE